MTTLVHTHPPRTRTLVRLVVGLVTSLSLTLLGCGETSLPAANASNSIPLAGISPHTIGVVRIDVNRCTQIGLERWLDKDAVKNNPFVRDVILARDSLSALGISAVVAPIPSIDFIPDELGIYLAGPSNIDREAIEEVFLKAGGLSVGGFIAEMAFAQDLGNGWYFYGWGEDGVIDDEDADRARSFADELKSTAPAIATAVFIPDQGSQFDANDLPQGEARAARRLRALCAAANDIRAIVVSGGTDDGSEWRIRFSSGESCKAALDAVDKAIHDVELMYEGSNPQVDLAALDLLGWRKLCHESVMKIDGDCIVVSPK